MAHGHRPHQPGLCGLPAPPLRVPASAGRSGLGVVRGELAGEPPHPPALLPPLLTTCPPTQVVLIGGVGGILGFDALLPQCPWAGTEQAAAVEVWSVWLDPPPPEEGAGNSPCSVRPQNLTSLSLLLLPLSIPSGPLLAGSKSLPNPHSSFLTSK